MKIKRIFHPIGQGAFYSERHENLNIVYDCGSKTAKKVSDSIVQNAFTKDTTIDILFISHFDSDHVNKISILKQHTKIKKVIMPLLHDEQKNFLLNIFRILNINLLTLIQEPKKFFGEDTDIIFVKPAEDNMPINDTNSRNIIDLKNKEEIESGTILTLNSSPSKKANWIFISYNFKYKDRNKDLEQKLLANGFDVNRLKTDSNYTLHEIQNDVSNKKLFKKIYNSLKKDGNDTCINENSMIVYSGVDKKHECQINYTYDKYTFNNSKNNNKNRVSCIYTGDTDLTKVPIKARFSIYWDYVNTIQIPHHGAEHNFEKSVLDDKYYICPISARTNNKHHPSSKVITSIISKNSYPILITENQQTEFIEEITIL